MSAKTVFLALMLAMACTVLVVACGEEEEPAAPGTPSPGATATATAQPTASPEATPTPTATPAPEDTPTPEATPTVEDGETPTPAPEDTPTPESTPTPEATPTAQDGETPTPGPTQPTEGGYELAPAVEWATFDRMVGFYPVPGVENEAVVPTQSGVLWRGSVEPGSAPSVFGDVSDRLISDPGNEEGLLGLAFSPAFSADGRVYLYYTAGDPRRSVLSRFQVVDGVMDPQSERVLLEIEEPFSNHNGGQLAFGPDGYLYVAVGDGGSAGDPMDNAQNLSTLLGSILRLDVSGQEYAVPPDNPFAETASARPEIYAYGLRNPWRFSFDRATGDLWAGDVGQNLWEEVDRVVPGGNYGWNIMEGFECYDSPECDSSGLEMPRAAYGRDVGCSVTGGYVYRGSSMPELDGWYIYSDYCTGRIWAVNTADDSPPTLLTNTGASIVSFGELPDGELVAVTFARAIYRLQRKA